jgi:hypothetical protein
MIGGQRRWRERDRELAERAARHPRAPLVLVPSLLGVRLVDPRGDHLWGTVRRLYRGPAAVDGEARPDGLLERFVLVPGLCAYDVYGRLLDHLERVGGYRRGRDLFALDYDWRAGIADAARVLAARLAEVAHAGPVDLLSVSTGGLVVRALLADASAAARVRRTIYVGTPQRGTFTALGVLLLGAQPAPLGRRIAPWALARLQVCWDCLPAPDERVFVDEKGAAAPHDLFAPATWRSLKLCSEDVDVARRLEVARRVRDSIEMSTHHPPARVIGGQHLPTPRAAVVTRDGRLVLPPCTTRPSGRLMRHLYEPGDGLVSRRSLTAVPGLVESQVRHATPAQHRELPSDPEVHRLVLEALIDEDVNR